MSDPDQFSDSIYERQMQLAERELSSFIAAVTEVYGRRQAELRNGGLARRVGVDG